MAPSQTKILLLVEGAKTEPKLMKRMAKIVSENYCSKNPEKKCELQIISFETHIYVLYKKIIELDSDFGGKDSTSTIEALNLIFSNDNREKERLLLNQKFPYIYLLFDFEYQDNLYNPVDKHLNLAKMLSYFNDETDNGLLLINYPMIESFRDYTDPVPSLKFNGCFVKDSKACNYKKIVGKRGYQCNVNNKKYDFNRFNGITLQNVWKTNYILNGVFTKPEYNDFINYLKGEKILDKEFEYISKEKKIMVLCCGLFVFISYYGKDYYLSL